MWIVSECAVTQERPALIVSMAASPKQIPATA